MPSCCVPLCKNNDRMRSKSLTFHRFIQIHLFVLYKLFYIRFPVENERKELWLKNIGRPEWTSSRNAVVCSHHFTEDSFDRCGIRVLLKKMSVPTYTNALRVSFN